MARETDWKTDSPVSLQHYLCPSVRWYVTVNILAFNSQIQLCAYKLIVPKLTADLYSICLVYRKFILKQMQYRFAVNFGTLSILSTTYLSQFLKIFKSLMCRYFIWNFYLYCRLYYYFAVCQSFFFLFCPFLRSCVHFVLVFLRPWALYTHLLTLIVLGGGGSGARWGMPCFYLLQVFLFWIEGF